MSEWKVVIVRDQIRDGPRQRGAVLKCAITKRHYKNKFLQSGRKIPQDLKDSELFPGARQNREIICEDCWDSAQEP